MSSAVFHKMTGSGNDFVMLDGRNTSLGQWPLERIVSVCDRREGIGADGLVFVTPLGDNRVQMVYFNADGSRAAMCGNAALCSTRFAAALEMADPAGMILVTDSGEFPTRCVGEGNQAELNLPDVDLPREVAIELLPGEHGPRLGVVGVPHLVTMVDDLQSVDVAARGRELRYHPAAGEAGANANFYGRLKCESTEAAAPTWGLRTYERGVEGETLSCGTGTVTAALAIAASGQDQLPLRFLSSGGQVLSVSARIEGGRARDIWLAGQGRLVARGVWNGDR